MGGEYMKKLMICVLVMFVFVCTSTGYCRAKAIKVTAVSQNAERVFTLAELSKYDGKNGRPAYIAVDGVVYDESGVPAWKSGGHKGGKAGMDITALIKRAPHGLKVLGERKIVGRLAGSAPSKNIQVKKIR